MINIGTVTEEVSNKKYLMDEIPMDEAIVQLTSLVE